jgi:uncharacterized damage-inducible protein DinB
LEELRMISPAFCETMSRYNRWMNERLYEVCAGLPEAVRKEDRGAPFGSIHGTLNHLLLADRIWMGRFTGRPFNVRSLDEELHADFAELRRARAGLDDEIAAWMAALTAEQLAGDLIFTSVVNPQRRVVPLWFAIQHFFNHQTHHRGQLTTLLEQAGCDFGVTDLIWLPGAAAPPGV